MDDQPSSARHHRRPPVPPGCVEVGHGQKGTGLAFGPPRYVITELLQVGDRGDRTWAAQERLYRRFES